MLKVLYALQDLYKEYSLIQRGFIKYGLVLTVKNREDKIIQLVEITPCYGEGKFLNVFMLFRSDMKSY